MARQFNPTKAITKVVYLSNEPRPARKLATFAGHLSPSGVERAMLFEKHIPRRCIQNSEHAFS